jgi:FAD:protein FMN transferase
MFNISSLIPKFSPQFGAIRHGAHFEGLLGTALELQVVANNLELAKTAEAKVLAEILRLERVFSRFLPDSELNCWQSAGSLEPSSDLRWLLLEAQTWVRRGSGAFNPASESLLAAYKNVVPNAGTLERLRSDLQHPLWEWRGDRVRKLTPLDLNFNALAKGRIADLAADAAMKLEGVHEVLVNLGGDLCHRGLGGIRVSLAHPFSSADNAPALAEIKISNQGVATSGHTHRGSHIYDPRSAKPTDAIAQASVIAADAASADVCATIFSVLEPEQSLDLANQLEIGCLIVTKEARVFSNSNFQTLMTKKPLEEMP